MQRGATLLELLVVLVIVGVLAGMVVPGSASLADRLAVEHEASRLLVAYRSAWLTARVQHRLALLRVTADSLAIWTVSGSGAPDTTLAWLAPGPAQAGVSIQGVPHTTVFAPYGAAMGFANTTHLLGRGSVSRQVVVSRLGRVRVLP
ncbi:MAG TPA: prepilin-type N-terminal cleavage/methylation domain-containing protein [Gemmatimonadales bacterium]|nr:prepilin-type N-terminal cleavage/methylation domain-containing protein [Gemmatimonadales bacterium]